MAQALYRKWRPQTFEEVVGQEHVVRTLRNALLSGRVHHAYLFAGPRGTGKTTTARLLAKAVNCLDPEPAHRPCNQCAICRAVNEGRLMDLIEIDAASNTSVEDVRELRERVGYRPSEARYKVYIIDEVHMLSTAAFNALLKTLEEPPSHAIFVLATTEPHRIPATVLSRCQRLDFRRVPLADMVARLRYLAQQEGIQADEDALSLIARHATGSMRDAESLLDQLAAYTDRVITVEAVRTALGTGDEGAILALTDALAARDAARGLAVINEAADRGADPRQFARQMTDHLRALMLIRLRPRCLSTSPTVCGRRFRARRPVSPPASWPVPFASSGRRPRTRARPGSRNSRWNWPLWRRPCRRRRPAPLAQARRDRRRAANRRLRPPLPRRPGRWGALPPPRAARPPLRLPPQPRRPRRSGNSPLQGRPRSSPWRR